MHIDKLDDVFNKYNNTYQSTIKMKPVSVKSSTYSDSSKEINDKNPKFKIGDNVRLSKYIFFFAKGYNTNLSEKVFGIEKVKNMLHICEHMLLMILMEKKLFERFTKTNCRKTNKKSLELKMESKEKVIKYMLNEKDTIIGLIVVSIKKA